MPEFRPAEAHGEIREIFPDVFFVTGQFHFARGMGITRNMTIVRQGSELVAINSVRLSAQGEAELERLGKLTHVIRPGFYHGADDPYFAHRFGAKLWARAGTGRAYEQLSSEHSPLTGAKIFAFEQAKKPECAVVLERHGGVCVPCDSFQNWTDETFAGCSLLARLMTRALGFRPAVIGKPWLKAMGHGVRSDFERLLDAPFSHLVPAHGSVLHAEAKSGLKRAIEHRFGS